MTLLLPQRERAFSDLLAAEKNRRLDAEKSIRELSNVLADLAVRLDGERLENMRRNNPSIPATWQATDWRKFFAEVSFLPASWDVPQPKGAKPDVATVALQEALERVTAERDRFASEANNLRTQLDDLTLQLSCSIVTKAPAESPVKSEQIRGDSPLPKPKHVPPPVSLSQVVPDQAILPSSDLPAGVIPNKAEMLSDLREMLKTLPDACPNSWVKKMNAGKSEPRSAQDAKKAWRRKAVVIYLVGRWGINAKLEIEHLIALSEGMKSNSGSLHRALDQIIEGGLLESEKMVMSGTNTALKLVRLSREGKKIYTALFNSKAVESEWERIIRLHEGERYPDHTLGILIFTMHARARGWQSETLPKTKDTNAVPDLRVQRGNENFYVEVELSNKEYNAKWRNNADINGGQVALCAISSERRARLSGDCKLLKLSGIATDIETLKGQSKYEELNEEVPLWVDLWEM